MKNILVSFLFLCTGIAAVSQSKIFKAQMLFPDKNNTSNAWVGFPLATNDRVDVDSTGRVELSLANPKHRIFFFSDGEARSKLYRFTGGACSTGTYRVVLPDYAFYRGYEKKTQCPVCLQTKNVLPIRYGMATPAMTAEAKKGKYILGGETILPHQPKYYCKKDDFDF